MLRKKISKETQTLHFSIKSINVQLSEELRKQQSFVVLKTAFE